MFLGIKNPLDNPENKLMQGKTSQGDEIHFATVDVIRKAYQERNLIYLVWDEEGKFDVSGTFNPSPKAKEIGLQPLLLDMFTASVVVQVLDQVNEENLELMTGMISKHRGTFGQVTDMCYKILNKATKQ